MQYFFPFVADLKLSEQFVLQTLSKIFPSNILIIKKKKKKSQFLASLLSVNYLSRGFCHNITTALYLSNRVLRISFCYGTLPGTGRLTISVCCSFRDKTLRYSMCLIVNNLSINHNKQTHNSYVAYPMLLSLHLQLYRLLKVIRVIRL